MVGASPISTSVQTPIGMNGASVQPVRSHSAPLTIGTITAGGRVRLAMMRHFLDGTADDGGRQTTDFGGDPRAVKRLGFKSASTLNDAFEMAEDVVGPAPTITHYKNPPLVMADVK